MFELINENGVFLLFTAIVGVLLTEWIPTLSQLAFPWIRLSLGQYKVPAMIQFASVFGIYGVDFLLLSCSALIALTLKSGEKKKRRSWCSCASTPGKNSPPPRKFSPDSWRR